MYFYLVFAVILCIICLVVALMFLISAIVGVPFVQTNHRRAELMMKFADLGPGKTMVDLGSGAGRLLFMAADSGANCIGYELNPILYWWTRFLILLRGKKGKVSVYCRSIYQADLSGVDVVTAYLFPGPMNKLADKLFSELKPGAKIVSCAFSIPGHVPVLKENGIFVYLTPVQ